jgi:hypothetical protein
LIKDYKLEVHDHTGKANVITDTLSCKAHCNYLPIVQLTREESSTRLLPNLSFFNIILTPTLRDEIIACFREDVEGTRSMQEGTQSMGHIKRSMQEGDLKVTCFREDVEGTFWYKELLVVPKKGASKKKILDEAHMSRYSIHPGSTKMYHDLR